MTRPIEPGTVVKISTGQAVVPRGSPAIFLSTVSGGVRVLTDASILQAVRTEIAVPKVPLPPFVPMRLRLAYGFWTQEDGSKVLFSRDYFPLWRISPDGRVAPEDPWRLIAHVGQDYFFDDVTPPWRNRNKVREVERRMTEMGANGTPKLVAVVDMLVRGEATTIRDAVWLMVPPGATDVNLWL